MQVKIKKLNDKAVIPSYAKEGDAGMDITATSRVYDKDGNIVYGTGLAFEIPKGYVGLLFPRSSNAKQDLILSNSVGVLDSGYRGEVLFKFKPASIIYNKIAGAGNSEDSDISYSSHNIDSPCLLDFRHYEIGDRIGQIVIIPHPEITFKEVDELSDSERGTGGYGSTGKKGNPSRKDGFYPIIKGDKFICTKNFVMDNGDVVYTKGKSYVSEVNSCITNNSGNRNHMHSEDGDLYKFLIKVK